jgi:hypothetical protein
MIISATISLSYLTRKGNLSTPIEWDDVQLEAESVSDPLIEMISNLIMQSNVNILQTLIASASSDVDAAWQNFNEGYAIDEDLYKLTRFQVMTSLTQARKHLITQ